MYEYTIDYEYLVLDLKQILDFMKSIKRNVKNLIPCVNLHSTVLMIHVWNRTTSTSVFHNYLVFCFHYNNLSYRTSS